MQKTGVKNDIPLIMGKKLTLFTKRMPDPVYFRSSPLIIAGSYTQSLGFIHLVFSIVINSYYTEPNKSTL